MPTNTCTALVVRTPRTQDQVVLALMLWTIGVEDEFDLLPEEAVLLEEWNLRQECFGINLCLGTDDEYIDLRGMGITSAEAQNLGEQLLVEKGVFCEHRLPWRQCTYCAPF